MMDDYGSDFEDYWENEEDVLHWEAYEPSGITCERCNTNGLAWKKYADRYTLVDSRGRIHDCKKAIFDRFENYAEET